MILHIKKIIYGGLNVVINLRELRENIGLTQEQLANTLGLTQEQVSRLENNPDNITMDIVFKLCNLAGVSPNDLMKYKPNNPTPPVFNDVYRDLRFKKEVLDTYINGGLQKFKNNLEYSIPEDIVNQLFNILNNGGAKPVVAFLGPSDAGKSRLINILTGLDKLLAQWTPTTATTVYIKHEKDKPEFMGKDNVWIFKAEQDNRPWNSKRFHDKDYCQSHKIACGDYSILRQYCNRDMKPQSIDVDAAIVYMDADILRLCDLTDLPGFGTEIESDSAKAERGVEQADILIFLCQANGFLNKFQDSIFLKNLIHKIPYSNNIPLLSNLLIVASQAHIVGEDEIENIFLRGYNAMNLQLNDEIIDNRFEITKHDFMTMLKDRFFSYSIENSSLRKSFEREIKLILEEIMPPLIETNMSNSLNDFKIYSKGFFNKQLELSKKAFQDYENLKTQFNNQSSNRAVFINKLDDGLKEIQELCDLHMKEDCNTIKDWEKKSISSERFITIITDKQYNKKQAQEFLASNVTDLYYLKLQSTLKYSTLNFNQQAKEIFQEIEDLSNELTKITINNIDIPFDFKGALGGGLASVGVLGGLSLYAASLGNLGGYIIVAKGVSLLSALGISVAGGTAGAVSAIAAIGGPVTLALGLGVATFLLGRKIFGDGWKERLSKQLYKKLKEEDLIEMYEDEIKKYWSETKASVEQLNEKIREQYESHLKYIENTLKDNNTDSITEQIVRNKEMLDFFAGIPWDKNP